VYSKRYSYEQKQAAMKRMYLEVTTSDTMLPPYSLIKGTELAMTEDGQIKLRIIYTMSSMPSSA
jgi:hypothetical protein